MKLFASDYDGTLRILPDVNELDKSMIEAWRAKGNLFVIVTGRSMESIVSEQKRNGFAFDYIIGNNGGIIYDRDLNCLLETLMDFDRALEVLSYIKTVPCISYVINDGFHRAKQIVDESKVDHKYGQIAPTMELDELLANKKIAQFVLSMDDMDLAKQVAQNINHKFQDAVTAYVNVNCIDIVPARMSKATGVQFIQNKHHIMKSDVYVIGDSYNDLPMIEAYHGYTLNHGEDLMKEKASKSFEGVAQALSSIL